MAGGVAPRVDLGDGWWTGSTPRLIDAIQEQLGLAATVVDARWLAEDRYAIELAPPPGGFAMEGARWVPLGDLVNSEVGSLLDHVDARETWLRPGWAGAIATWIDDQLAAIGYERTGPPEQLKHWSISALLRVPARPHDVVFKEVAPFFAQEAPIINVLRAVGATVLPEPLAVEGGRWLMPAFDGDLPDRAGHPDYDEVLRVHARLQIGAARHVDALAAAGAPDHRGPELARRVSGIAEREDFARLMDTDEHGAFVAALPRIVECCLALDALDIPATVIHGDFHQWNTIRTAQGWLVFDWTDASVGNPFLDLCPWLWHIDDPAERVRATDVFATAWADAIPMTLAKEACRLAQVAAAAHYALDYEMLIDGVAPAYRGEWFPAFATWMGRSIEALAGLGDH